MFVIPWNLDSILMQSGHLASGDGQADPGHDCKEERDRNNFYSKKKNCQAFARYDWDELARST